MQDRLTGGIGDFGKFGLLRMLAVHADAPQRLGVVWFRRTAAETDATPAVDYLAQPAAYSPRDEKLFDALAGMVHRGSQGASAVQRSRILGADAAFHDEPVDVPAEATDADARRAFREAWLARALAAVQGCDVVYLDPDAGVAPPESTPGDDGAAAYVYPEELRALAGQGHALVVSHPLLRGNAAQEAAARMTQLREALGDDLALRALRYGPAASSLLFLVVPAERLVAMEKGLRRLLDAGWGADFSELARDDGTVAAPAPADTPPSASTPASGDPDAEDAGGEPPEPPITFDDFRKVDVRVGTVVRAEAFPKARRPAYKLWIDFGPELGEKKTSAQITDLYDLEGLVGRQVVAVVNFPPKQVADFKSEVLVLGAIRGDDAVVLLHPDRRVTNGLRIA